MVKEMIKIDPAKVKLALKGMNIPINQASYAAGYKAKNSLSTCLNRGEIPELNFRLLCVTYGLNPESLKPSPDAPEEQETDKKEDTSAPSVRLDGVEARLSALEPRLAGIEAQLSRIADALEALATAPDIREAPTLSKIERCTLLLKQMTCYGSCKKEDFENKASEYGLSPDVQSVAIKSSKLKSRLRDGVEWLSKT